jgi:hypothetical protein
MTDAHDPFDDLVAADPARRHGSPPDDPQARGEKAEALFERIIMDTTTHSRRRPVALAVAAAAVAIAVVGTVAAINDGDDPSTTTTTVVAAPDPGGPISPGGMASCVERYDLITLGRRELAFDGTVSSVDGDQITFDVDTWYRGGDGPTATLRGAQFLGGMTSAGPSTSLEPGIRLLVAGDGDFAWSCGFTQPYDPAVAADWAATFAP